MTEQEYSYKTKNQSDIEEDITLTREEVRAIKKLAETTMNHRQVDEDCDEPAYAYPLGGSNWADLDDLRTKCKMWLVKNQ